MLPVMLNVGKPVRVAHYFQMPLELNGSPYKGWVNAAGKVGVLGSAPKQVHDLLTEWHLDNGEIVDALVKELQAEQS